MSKIQYIDGDIFSSKCETIICPATAVGILNGGLADKFKQNSLFKSSNEAYRAFCLSGQAALGSCLYTPLDKPNGSLRGICYMITKMNTSDSKLEYVELGFFNLLKTMNYYNLTSVATPLVGSGLGNLSPVNVEHAIENTFFCDHQNYLIEVYKFKK